MDRIFIYDYNGISVSVVAKTEAAAYKILKENVISPELFTKESDFSLEDLTID